jgi:hypothetical protein
VPALHEVEALPAGKTGKRPALLGLAQTDELDLKGSFLTVNPTHVTQVVAMKAQSPDDGRRNPKGREAQKLAH